ncbi:hypothetical protein C8R44DRAFT_858689 [Mycena epipterygia]|nr:hypothetical protein C8R44DRAFT_858689 [Mycena epipterygia]
MEREEAKDGRRDGRGRKERKEGASEGGQDEREEKNGGGGRKDAEMGEEGRSRDKNARKDANDEKREERWGYENARKGEEGIKHENARKEGGQGGIEGNEKESKEREQETERKRVERVVGADGSVVCWSDGSRREGIGRELNRTRYPIRIQGGMLCTRVERGIEAAMERVEREINKDGGMDGMHKWDGNGVDRVEWMEG